MTRTLDAAIAELTALPPDEQDRIAQWILEELKDEARWSEQFGASQDALARLAASARADRARGRTTEIDSESL